MELAIEQRAYPRIHCQLIVRVYTSVVSGSYLVEIKNISRGGAFFCTKFLPKKGETISYELVDKGSFKVVYQGLGKVARVNDSFTDSGFSVIFYDLLSHRFFTYI